MQQVEFSIPKNCNLTAAEDLIEQVCSGLGLQRTRKGSLAAYPGCVHWHFAKPKEKGTLELTLFRSQMRVWAKVQAGRNAAWIEEALQAVRTAVEEALKNNCESNMSAGKVRRKEGPVKSLM